MATGRATDPCLTSGVRDLSPYGDSSLSVHMATGRATDPCLTSGVRDLSPYGDSSLSVHMAASEFHAGRYRSSDLRGPCCSDWGLPDYVSLAAVWRLKLSGDSSLHATRWSWPEILAPGAVTVWARIPAPSGRCDLAGSSNRFVLQLKYRCWAGG
jgi:hypothetical protein